MYNRINNGGNKAQQWRVLTKEEWEYLIGSSTQRSGKCGIATIKGLNKTYTGFIILPDDWTLPSGVTFTSGTGSGYSTNIYTMAQWQRMEAAGALFFPCAGDRQGTTVSNAGENAYGYYWSSTYSSAGGGYQLSFGFGGYHVGTQYREMGEAVRLVKD